MKINYLYKMQQNLFKFLFLLFLLDFSSQTDYKSYILSLGLNLEERTYITEDRYINTVWVLTSKNESKRNKKSIILQHGLLDGAWTWLIKGKNSLAYLFAEEGYKVYLNYIRGSQFSKSHLDYDTGLFSKYWDFSFDEMAKYDLPALIEFVKENDRVEKVDYVGHSQGTLIYFLAYMNDPSYMERNINKFVALGTVPNVNNASHFYIKIFEKTKILDYIPIKNFLTFPIEIGQILAPFCSGIGSPFCTAVLKYSFGGIEGISLTELSKLNNISFLYEPGGTSLKNMRHWIQIYKAKKTQKYDYGSSEENIEHYGTEIPPIYDNDLMKDYSIPSFMTISDSDPFANQIDTLEFISKIINGEVVKVKSLSKYNHIDYIWSDDANQDIYPDLFEFLKNDQ